MAKFRCWDDCTEAGCPGHEIEVKRQNSVMLLCFVEDGRNALLLSEAKFEAMMQAYNERYGKS